MRHTIRAGIEEYTAMEDRLKDKISKIDNGTSAPSAPSEHLDDEAPTAPSLSEDDNQPSAPALIQTFHSPECVVCLERKVSPAQVLLWLVSTSFAKKIITLAANYMTLLSLLPKIPTCSALACTVLPICKL